MKTSVIYYSLWELENRESLNKVFEYFNENLMKKVGANYELILHFYEDDYAFGFKWSDSQTYEDLMYDKHITEEGREQLFKLSDTRGALLEMEANINNFLNINNITYKIGTLKDPLKDEREE